MAPREKEPFNSSKRSPGGDTAVPGLAAQLQAILARLKKRHPELTGIGLGARRRRYKYIPEVVVKFQVRKKHRRPREGVTFLPKSVKLKAIVLGRVVTVSLPTDVETPRRVRPSQAHVGGMTASALASWNDSRDGTCLGVITASHGLDQPSVPVQLGDGTQTEGTVVARSDLAIDGYDVGLVKVDVADKAQLPEIGRWLPPLATAEQLLEMLSGSPDDCFGADAESWYSSSPQAISACAFYIEWQWHGFDYPFKYVVHCSGLMNTFEPGTSGSTWVTQPPTRLVMALQSHGLEPLFQEAFGTHFLSAIQWLQNQPGISNLKVAWRPADL